MTREILEAAGALLAGIGLGLFFFGGLWLTVRSLPHVRRPGRRLFLSFLVRTAVVLLGFYAVMSGDWRRMLLCLAGFLIGRVAMACMVGRTASPKRATHART